MTQLLEKTGKDPGGRLELPHRKGKALLCLGEAEEGPGGALVWRGLAGREGGTPV